LPQSCGGGERGRDDRIAAVAEPRHQFGDEPLDQGRVERSLLCWTFELSVMSKHQRRSSEHRDLQGDPTSAYRVMGVDNVGCETHQRLEQLRRCGWTMIACEAIPDRQATNTRLDSGRSLILRS
jgi:hypothetical protein